METVAVPVKKKKKSNTLMDCDLCGKSAGISSTGICAACRTRPCGKCGRVTIMREAFARICGTCMSTQNDRAKSTHFAAGVW